MERLVRVVEYDQVRKIAAEVLSKIHPNHVLDDVVTQLHTSIAQMKQCIMVILYTPIYIHIYIYIYIYIHIHVMLYYSNSTHTQPYICENVFVHSIVFLSNFLLSVVCHYIPTHIYTHAHKYIHTHT